MDCIWLLTVKRWWTLNVSVTVICKGLTGFLELEVTSIFKWHPVYYYTFIGLQPQDNTLEITLDAIYWMKSNWQIEIQLELSYILPTHLAWEDFNFNMHSSPIII